MDKELKSETTNIKNEVSKLQDVLYSIQKDIADTKKLAEAIIGRLNK